MDKTIHRLYSGLCPGDSADSPQRYREHMDRLDTLNRSLSRRLDRPAGTS